MNDWFLPKPQPDISCFGLRITEPVTALTGVLITACCVYAWLHLGGNSPEHSWMRTFFIFIGLSNLVSAIFGHALLYRFSHVWKAPGWVLGMVGVTAVTQAAISHAADIFSPMAVMILTILNGLTFAVLLGITLRRMTFKMVELHAAFSLLILMFPIEAYLMMEHNLSGSIWMLMALVPSVVAVLLHILKFTPSPWLNFFDLGHLLLCGTVWCFMLAGERM